jgi:hypothetical protein
MPTLEIEKSKLLPELVVKLKSLEECPTDMDRLIVEYLNMGFKVISMCSIEVTGIEKPIKDVCRTIESEMKLSRDRLNQNLSLIHDSVSKTTEGVVEKVGMGIEKQIVRMDATNKPLLDRLDSLNRNVEALMGGLTTSSKRGKIGENILIRTLEKHYPRAIVEDTSKVSNQADIHFTFPKTKESVWIEVKTYSDTVPTKEVEKFKKEMQENKIKFGIFASRSGIARHHNIEIESLSYGGSLFYIPNIDVESRLVVFALMWIEYLKGVEDSSKGDTNLKVQNEVILNLIVAEIEHLGNMSKHFCSIKKKVDKSFKSMKREIEKSMEDIDCNISNLETEFEKSIYKLKGILSVV